MQTRLKVLITVMLLGAAAITLQECRKADKKQTDNWKQELAYLRSQPQLVFKKTVTTTDQLKQMINDDQTGRIDPLVCTINANAALLQYFIIHTGDCTNESYTLHIYFAVWNTYHTDDGGRTHTNPNPVLSTVQLTINGHTVNAFSVEYPYAPDDTPGAWLCVFEVPYSSLGLATQTTSFTPTITGTFTCTTNSNTGNLNYSPGSQTINACTADGVATHQANPQSGLVYFFFPWDIIACGTEEWLTPTSGACNIYYRPSGSGGSYTVVHHFGAGPETINSLASGDYEYKSVHVCSGTEGTQFYTGTFHVNP